MKKIAALCFSLCLLASICFGEVGLINDPDGYTNVREDASLKSKIVGKIYKDQVFQYFPSEDAKWYCVAVDGNGGYIHSSKVVSIAILPSEKIREIIFAAYKKMNDWLKGKIKLSEAEGVKFNDDVYDVALAMARDYVAENKDEELLSLFFENYLLDSEGFSESPSISIGESLLIAPEFVCNQALKTGNKEVYNLLKLGLERVGYEANGDLLTKVKAADMAVEAIKKKF